MSTLVTYARSGPVSRIVINDGKVNIFSTPMLEALHASFDTAEQDQAVVLLTGSGQTFSAGFDLKVFANGSALDLYTMLKTGAELALRILSFPLPVVIACNGNALALGAFLLLAGDLRIGVEGPYKIGLNEVAIGIRIPAFGVELARQRLSPAYLNRSLLTGETYTPFEAAIAGFLDRAVPAEALAASAEAAADTLSKINLPAHTATKALVRGPAIAAIRAAIDRDITLEDAERRVAERDGKRA